MNGALDGPFAWWLVYLGVGGAVCLALRRTGHLPGRVGATLLALGLVLPAPALVRGEILGPADRIFDVPPWKDARVALGVEPESPTIFADVWTQMIPWQRVVREAWLGGEWPLWNPYVLSGTPLSGSFSTAPYWPPTLVALLSPAAETHTLLAALKVFFAALTAFLLLRDRGSSEGAALVGAAAWAFSTFHLFWLGWPQTSVTCLLPLVLLGSGRLARTPSAGNLALLSAALALAALGGHAETLAHVLVLAVVDFALAWWLAPDRGRWRARVLAGLGAGALALAVAAIFVIPFLADLTQTAELADRQARTALPRRGARLAISADGLVGQFVPFRFGVLGRGDVEGARPHEHFSNAYPGSVALCLAAVGAFGARRRGRWPLVVAAAAGIGAGVSFAPVIRTLHQIPILNLAVHQRLVFVAAWALAALAAFGWDRLAGPEDAGRIRRPWLVAALAALLAAAAGAALWAPLRTGGLTAELLTREIAWYVAPLAALAALLAFGATRRGLAYVVVGLVVAQRAGELGHIHAAVPRAADYPVVPPLGRLVTGDAKDARIVGLGAYLLPNVASALGLQDVRGYEPMTFARYEETMPLWAEKRWFTFHPVNRLDRPFLSFLGVRHAVVSRFAERPPGWRSVGGSPAHVVLRNDAALPLAFVPERLHAVVEPGRTVADMAAGSDFAREAWLELDDGSVAPPRNAGGRVERIERVGLGRYELRTRFESAGWVVTSIPAWRGWRASGDGRRLETAIANHAFVAVRVPGGVADWTLRYRPAAFDLGLALTAAGLAAWIGLVFAVRRRRRAVSAG